MPNRWWLVSSSQRRTNGATLCERGEKATRATSLSPLSPFAMEIDIDTGHWNLIHSAETRTRMFVGKIRYALSLFQKEGKFQSLVGGRE